MKTLTVNERINFKSHFPACNDQFGFQRIKRVDHYGHMGRYDPDSNTMSFNIPYWHELQTNRFVPNTPFRNKF